ncbi:MAG: hypothetical protein Q4G09_00205 [Clostridia bacterium]|nr:hypothetical protein [Clostridia bacterium]
MNNEGNNEIYDIEIIEINKRVIGVDAKTFEEAREWAKNALKSGDVLFEVEDTKTTQLINAPGVNQVLIKDKSIQDIEILTPKNIDNYIGSLSFTFFNNIKSDILAYISDYFVEKLEQGEITVSIVDSITDGICNDKYLMGDYDSINSKIYEIVSEKLNNMTSMNIKEAQSEKDYDSTLKKEKELIKIFTESFIKDNLIYEGMIPANADIIKKYTADELNLLINKGIIQTRNCNGLAYEFTQPYKDELLEIYWKQLEDIPFDIDEQGEEKLGDTFLYFTPGETTKEDIWHFFDKNYSKGVYYLIYEFEIPEDSLESLEGEENLQ